MAVVYADVVPWGRSFQEYRDMFALTEADLDRSILGCGDGPAAFNAAMRRRGKRVVSVDPLYGLEAAAIARRIDETFPTVMAQTRANADRFVWTSVGGPDALGELRMSAMREFLADFPAGKREGRYVAAGLPGLPFADGRFELCLVSHFLFLYSANLSLDFHLRAIDALLRVAGEVRIFPLLDFDARPSPHLDPVLEHYARAGFAVARQRVPYEFQRGGHTMLRLWRAAVPRRDDGA